MSGQLTTRARLDYESPVNSFQLQVTVTDGGGLNASNWVTVLLEDVNEPPFLPAANRSVDENTGAYLPVGAPLPAHDPDSLSGQELKFTITTKSSPFRVDYCTGQLSVFIPLLNFESKNVYELVVRVRNAVPSSSLFPLATFRTCWRTFFMHALSR